MCHFQTKDTDSDEFPAPWVNFICGMQVTTYEARLQNVYICMILYHLSLTKTYNYQTIVTLLNVSFVSKIIYIDVYPLHMTDHAI